MRGAAANSVEKCGVTAMSNPDGTAEMKTQRPIAGHVGLGATLLRLGSMIRRGGALTIKTAHPATSRMSSTKPKLHIRFCICNVNTGSNSAGYASSARKLPTFDAAKTKKGTRPTG